MMIRNRTCEFNVVDLRDILVLILQTLWVLCSPSNYRYFDQDLMLQRMYCLRSCMNGLKEKGKSPDEE